jgi:uroporphyrinogen-III synthase
LRVGFAVLTRDPVDAQAYAAPLAALGLEVVAMPVTRIAPPPDPEALRRAVAAGGYAAVVVASPRAVHELVRAADGELPEIWAVGPATARALAIAGLRAHHPAGVRDSAELAQRLVASRPVRGARVLVPRAEEGRTEGLAILREAGAEVVDVVAYRTVPTEPGDPALARGAELLRGGGGAICAVFAPSQVVALAGIVGPLAELAAAFCAIGETTAAALRAAGIAAPSVADVPTPEGMARAIARVYPRAS